MNDVQITYPQTARTDQIDHYHGVSVADPYRWLEDDHSPETAEWVRAQNEVTFGYLQALPFRESFRRRLTEISDQPRQIYPVHRSGRYFVSRNDGLQNQDVVYVSDGLDGPQRVLIDPNLFSEDGTIALTGIAISDDGASIAYAASESGSDWAIIRARDVESGEDHPDRVEWVKFSGITWTKDGKGYFYSRYAQPEEAEVLRGANLHHTLYYHRLRSEQSDDLLIYDHPELPEAILNGSLTDDGRYLLIYLQHTGSESLLYYVDLVDPLDPRFDGPVVRLIDRFEAHYSVIGNDGPLFYMQTNLDAPRGRVVAVDINAPERENWSTVIPEGEDLLENVSLVGETLFLTSLHDAYSRITLHRKDGAFIRELPTPVPGTVMGVGGRRNDAEIFYMFTSFLYRSAIYRYDLRTDQQSLYWSATLGFDPEDYETSQVWYNSKDGTRVPMFISHRRGLKRDGSNPTILYGYGGFNVPMTPSFSAQNLLWMEMGGIYAMPNLRGGGEFGEEWYRAGTLERKQNVFDDFIAAAEHLIAEGYCTPAKLALHGVSNGGLLVGAVMCQRPDLFAVALPEVGVLDMLRYHEFTIGMAWSGDYGLSSDPDHFPLLYAYSPLHNLYPGTRYPATMILTADHDDRVVPAHSFKFAARLQECHTGPEPVLIRISIKAGHGAGKPMSKWIQDAADMLAFTAHRLGMDEDPIKTLSKADREELSQ